MSIRSDRDYLPQVGWPVFDLRRRKFGICIEHILTEKGIAASVHIEGDRYPITITPELIEYEYPKFYNNDEVEWNGEPGYYIKHVHYHVPRDIWQYTISKQGMEGFDRFVVEGEKELKLLRRFISKI